MSLMRVQSSLVQHYKAGGAAPHTLLRLRCHHYCQIYRPLAYLKHYAVVFQRHLLHFVASTARTTGCVLSIDATEIDRPIRVVFAQWY